MSVIRQSQDEQTSVSSSKNHFSMVKYLTAICCLLTVFTNAQKTDEKLEKKITDLVL